MRRVSPRSSPRLALTALAALTGALLTVPGAGGQAAPTVRAAAALAAAPMAEDCDDALLVAVTGGGEGGTGDPGSTLAALTAPLAAEVRDSGRTLTTRVVHAPTRGPVALRGQGGKRTPAHQAVTRSAWRTWQDPVGSLTSGLGVALAETLPGCPDQLVYLAGYSQGAEAVHRYLARRADADLRSRTVAVVLVADPARRGGSDGPLAGDPAASRKAAGVSARFARTPLPAVPQAGWHAPVHSVCTAGDLGCDLGATRFRRAQRVHASYDTTARRLLGELGQRYGARLALWPRPVTGQVVEGRVGLLLNDRLRVAVARQSRRSLRFEATSPLPPGLDLDRRGVLSGTPTRAGSVELDYTVRNASSPAVSRPATGQVTIEIAAGARTEVSAGGRHTCEIRAAGTLWCWGANFYGQLGVGDTTGGPTPRQVGRRSDWVEVSAGGMHTCAAREDGSLWCWGLNYRGQLGTGTRKDQVSPKRVGTGTDWEHVSAGWVHTCATTVDGTAWCWGDNDFGQLGRGNQRDSYTPAKVAQGRAWSEVTAGGWHTCGVTRGGAAYCWGRNIKGQIGDGTEVIRVNPARVGQADDWLSVQPAWTHTCGLRENGSMSCWGGNEGGQLAGGGFGGSPTPQPVGTGRLWSAVQTGVNFSCGLDTDQAMWCWGTGRSGQLTGSTRTDNPARMFSGTRWAQIDLGWLFGCGQTGSGTTPACWGNNETGELGSGGTRASRPSARATDGFGFTLTTFNTLGSNHTSPRTDAAEYTPARIRTEWMIDYLRSIDSEVVGFQEIQRDQLTWFTKGASDTYAVWPGTTEDGKGLQTTIAWKKSVWRLVRTDLVPIPFITQTRYMPLVRLEHRATGRHIWVMNVHNAPQDYQSQRNTALKREIARLDKVVGKGDPVFLVGDFNERHRAYCEVSGKLGLVAPRGGGTDGAACNPPSGSLRVDWIFGPRNADYSGYTEDRSPLVRLMTDHAVLRAEVSVP